MNLCVLATLASVLTDFAPGSPQPAPDHEMGPVVSAVDDGLLKELEEIDARGTKIEDLIADFSQEKFTALLKKPLVSEGKVRMCPPRTRWDTSKPRKSVLLLDDRELRLYDPEARTLEVYDIAGGLSRMTASPVPRLAAVKDEFAIRRLDPATLDPRATAELFVAVSLTPTAESMKEHVAEVRVLIDRSLACATLVEVTDADGDRTVIRFENLKLNTGLDAEDLDLRVPDGTATSRPLDGMGGPSPGDGGER